LKLIVGLGNPGERYANSRQNLGFKVVDIIANNNDIDIKTKKKKSLIGRGSINDAEVVLLKPQTFINISGEAVLYIASFLRIQVQDIICVCDDMETEFGKVQVEFGGGSRNNLGIESLIKNLKSDKFTRIYVGVAPQTPPKNISKYLLSDFTEAENLQLIDVLNLAEEAAMLLVTRPVDEVIKRINQ
jgi:PTH1 family peptidyl-tRNA hydrolase